MIPSSEMLSSPLPAIVGASGSTVALWLAETISDVSPISRGWIELGGTIGLIGFLSYGCITLWKKLQEREEMATLERDRHRLEINSLYIDDRNERRQQTEKLIEVLNKLDPDHR